MMMIFRMTLMMMMMLNVRCEIVVDDEVVFEEDRLKEKNKIRLING